MKLNCEHLSAYLTQKEYELYVSKHHDALTVVDNNAFQSDMLGWVDANNCTDTALQQDIKLLATEIRARAEVFLVVGLGGSNQGARAVIDALTPQDAQSGGPEIIYAALNLSAAYHEEIIRKINGRSLYINVIAKNFKTLEPGLTFRLLRRYMESHYTNEEAACRIITTATQGDGQLHRISLENGYRCLPFPSDVGGRYSVFTAVGLLPIAVAGINIDQLMEGVASAQGEYLHGGVVRECARQYAITRNVLMEKCYGIEVLAFFEPQLEALGRWWRQLFGESEGKEHTALFPAVCSYTEDLHSVGQYMQQGKRQLVETFIQINTPPADFVVANEPHLLDGFDYLNGKTLHEINQAAYRATILAHSEGGVPCMVIEVEALNAYNLGELMYFYFVACYYSSVLLGVDPFDQPGVENYKSEMFRLLGAC